ncbi:D-isomer specific 2-hydroxyacid dehydrogenase [Sodiomyces alkalinus F11]|uniref:D-isomer specific 2-hydroxyacid dehydrogenase n=1 Tax=Sodiomyces alkalinus (strain CBS 110278 / VKM F-3762 / F11) TaxID=1314773 RepID=A0A3N2PJ76_SODAK|nr:D-isomer specific 2-hydroxyacid dehydrogenase [Sodiomyces alkalinus F11]ROT34593.1 D-isomer specific 2-hydroxyacid dehydrogenase [Sodiomyces alkalinus F11]
MAEPANTPIPGSTPRSGSPTHSQGFRSPSTPSTPTRKKPGVLHIGDPIKYHPDTYALFSARCDIIRPSTAERQRDEFKRALAENRWGDFQAVFRPAWGTGGEMGGWDEELIALLPDSVRVFASAGAGFDWVDVRRLGERGIIYCNSSPAAADAVADFALAMIISTFRHLPWCAAASADPTTFQDCHARATLLSHTLRGQVLGLIGFGHIGQAIAARARPGFGMAVHYHDLVRKDPALEARLSATFHPSLADLLRLADCLVLCTPSTGDGRPVITASTLQRCKPGARFVNVARGGLVDEEALADALESGHLSSVALDVHASEPNVNPRLAALRGDRVLLTCHNAGGTVETHAGFEDLSMRNIMAVLGGGEPITPVNLEFLRRS